jgi:hypothetical protein
VNNYVGKEEYWRKEEIGVTGVIGVIFLVIIKP